MANLAVWIENNRLASGLQQEGSWLSGKGLRFDSRPGLIPGSWIMMRHVSCILLLEWSTTSQRLWVYRIYVPYEQQDPGIIFKKSRGQPRGILSLISTTDGSTLPQDRVVGQLC